MRMILLAGMAALLAGCSPAPSADVAAPSLPVVRAAAPAPAPRPPVDLSGGTTPGFSVTSVLGLDKEIDYGDYAWNAEGVPAGPLRVVVDLTWQRVYVYRSGVEIGRASMIYGADDKPTPTGTFPILEKDADHVSNLYDAPMPNMLRLTWDGIALHASTVEYAAATHGCIGLPEEFSALLFAEAKKGDEVLVTNGWMRPVYGRMAQGTPVNPAGAPATLPTI